MQLTKIIQSLFALVVAGAALLIPSASQGAGCLVKRHGTDIELQSPAFTYTLDTADGLRARSWQNNLADRKISLGLGPEVALDFDAADQRIWISGWKHEGDKRTTHVFLPPNARDKKLTLTLGGFGVYDFREIDVELNGQEVGTRHATGRWREPGEFDLGPGSRIYPSLRFGEDNILVIHCREPITRTRRMDELGVTKGLPGRNSWPAQFEQYLTVGAPLATPALRVVAVRDKSTPSRGEFIVELESGQRDTRVTVAYRWNADEPVLHKFTEVVNQARRERRLMNVRLGDYPTDTTVSDGEQGFPVYLGDSCFMGLAHPSGWAIGQDQHVLLRQYPGKLLAVNERFPCMEEVIGASRAGEEHEAFVDQLRKRTRRVLRGHDRPYAIYDTFGANEEGGRQSENYMLNEKYVLEMLDKVEQGKKDANYQFDYCNTHFWVDHDGDLERFNPVRFPNGFTNIKAKLDEMGIKPGLWIDSSWADWSIGGNPVVHRDFTHDPAYEKDGFNGEVILCRASDPVRTMYSTAFEYHIKKEGVRLIKCDNLRAICYNPNHTHLPGVYSTEAIQSGVLQTLRDWDAANPDVFIMLYWGYRSPWWLLDGDTIFESGLDMEAASAGPGPTLHARDGVTVGLDQGQWWREDVPPLGKDSLGVWLSDWDWNSRIGKDRWQDGFAMDICRGSMLAQIWTDFDWLSAPERKQLAEFIALLKAQPQCFGNPRFVVGNPWKHEPYGYCCTDGKRAFVALNNCTWSDARVALELNSKWGLDNSGQWDIYRWYPEPAKMENGNAGFGGTAAISLRPFEVVLLEVVPSGQRPSLDRTFSSSRIPNSFAEPSRVLDFEVTAGAGGELSLKGSVPACAHGGTLAVTDTGRDTILTGAQIAGKSVASSPPPAAFSWQVWRMSVEPCMTSSDFELKAKGPGEEQLKRACKMYFIPAPAPAPVN